MSRFASLSVVLPGLVAAVALGWSADAQATDGIHVEVHETRDDDGEVVEVVETTEVHSGGDQTWGGLFVGTTVSPFRVMGPTDLSWRVNANQAQACLDPSRARGCGNLRGFDTRLVLFEANGRRDYPWAVGYFRTGYTGGRVTFNPRGADGFVDGDTRNLSYMTVPLFFGGNVYFFDKFPVRPFAGLGAGFDVLRIQYERHNAPGITDASGRIGFEVHAGIEARITNHITLSAEVRQLWSARNKIGNAPDFSNQGLSIVTGVTLALPSAGDRRHKHRHVKKTIRRVERVEAAPAPAPEPPPIPETLKTPAEPPVAPPPAPPAAPEVPEVAPEPPAPAPAPEAPAPAPAPA